MSKKYIIIGGGAAGIAAAYTILESSKTSFVYLFEASGIYGGRAKTDKYSIAGLNFDMGCVYIQDPGNPENPWPEIARSLQFETVEDTADYMMRINTGSGFETVNVTAIKEINDIVDEIEQSYNINKTIPNIAVVPDAFPDDQFTAFALGNSPYGPFTESSEPWNYLAADRAREQSGNWGNNLFVKKGLGTLVKTYGERLKVLYSVRYTEIFKAIKEVTYSDNVTVKDTSNNVYTADACIITVPVSVLAAGTIKFVPELSKSYKSALNTLQLGSYKKLAFQLTFTPKEIADNVNYYLYNNEPKGIWQFYRLPYFPKNTFVVHTAGQFAEELDRMADDKVFELFESTFRAAYNDEPVFVKKYGITKWNNSNYILGAYSYSAPSGQSVNDPVPLKARKQMSKPIMDKIFFAGEAYNLAAYGTLHGAYIDGKDAALTAIQALEKSAEEEKQLTV